MANLQKARRLLTDLQDSLPYELLEEETIQALKGLDKELSMMYDSLRRFQNRPRGFSELMHTIVNMVEDCCCVYWRERMSRDSGDFCPDCYLHGARAGLKIDELRLVKGKKKAYNR